MGGWGGGWVGGWVAGWLDQLEIMLTQPNLSWDWAELGKSQLKGTSSRKKMRKDTKQINRLFKKMAKIIFKVKIRVFKKIILNFLARKAHPWVVI